MSEVFDVILERGFTRVQPRATPLQAQCRAFTQERLRELLCTRHRERYCREAVVCVGGYVGSDQDEALTLTAFSQMQFFELYDALVFFVDKFDFLVRAVAHGVCNVAEGFEPSSYGVLASRAAGADADNLVHAELLQR